MPSNLLTVLLLHIYTYAVVFPMWTLHASSGSASCTQQVFSEVEDKIGTITTLASVIMAAVVAVIICVTGGVAYAVSAGITRPVNQLIDVVRELNTMDLSDQVRLIVLQ